MTTQLITLEFSEAQQDFHVKQGDHGPDEFTHGYETLVRGLDTRIGFKFKEYIRKRYKIGNGGHITMKQVKDEWRWYRSIFKDAGSKTDLPQAVKYAPDRDYVPDAD